MERCKHYTLDCEQEKRTCEGCAYCKKSADEMFERLGYIEHIKNKNNEIYRTDSSHCAGRSIIFQYKCERITLPQIIDMKELKAINKKVEELGWE